MLSNMLLKNLIKNCPTNLEKIKVKGLSSDTRTLKKGNLFFALKGSKYDASNLTKLFEKKNQSDFFKNINKEILINIKEISTNETYIISNFNLKGTSLKS